MSDRLRCRAAHRPRLAQEAFDVLHTVSGHDWLLGGPWDALEPALLAITALGYDRLSPGQRERWERVLDVLSAETDAALQED